MIGSPVYEFPYSGSIIPPSPFINYNIAASSSWNNLPDSLMYNQHSTYNDYSTSHIPSSRDNNVIVYQVPDYIPLDTILRQLGVDVGSLHRSSSINNQYFNMQPPMELILPRRSRRSRRLVCHEVSDSDSERDYSSRRQSSLRRRRQSYNDSDLNQEKQPPDRLHTLLGNIWKKTTGATNNIPQPNAGGNMNQMWQSMLNAGPPGSTQFPSSNGNAMNPPGQPNNPNSGVLAKLFSGNKSDGGAVLQPPQQNLDPTKAFLDARNLPTGTNPSDLSIANAWGSMNNTAQQGPPQQTPSAMNSMWNQMAGAQPPQQPTSSAVNSMWNQMAGAQPSQQPTSSAVNSMWNQMVAAAQSPQQSTPPAMNSMWSQMAGAQPSQQQAPSAMNSMWGQISGAAPPPPVPPQQAATASGSMWNKISKGKIPFA